MIVLSFSTKSDYCTDLILLFQEGRTALHYAALNGYAEVVQHLAIEGASVDSQDNVSTTNMIDEV